jgi:hypothetical protein
MASVSPDDVRDVLNVNDSDIPDVKVEKMIKRAAVTVGLELSAEIDSANCTDAQKEAITVLAAIYAYCFMTGGSAAGLSFSVGDLRSEQRSLPDLAALQSELERILDCLKVRVGSA